MSSAKQNKTAIFFIIIISLLTLNNFININNSKNKIIINNLDDELSYWKRIVYTYPSYRDGYLEIARLEALLGNTSSSSESLSVVKNNEPNSNKVMNFTNILGAETD